MWTKGQDRSHPHIPEPAAGPARQGDSYLCSVSCKCTWMEEPKAISFPICITCHYQPLLWWIFLDFCWAHFWDNLTKTPQHYINQQMPNEGLKILLLQFCETEHNSVPVLKFSVSSSGVKKGSCTYMHNFFPILSVEKPFMTFSAQKWFLKKSLWNLIWWLGCTWKVIVHAYAWLLKM